MKKIVFLTVITVIFFSLSFTSCKEDELSEDIQNFVPDSLLQTIIDLGMPVNKGLTPPNIETIYQASPFVLVSSNSGDEPGYLFSDLNVQFSEQNNDSLSVVFSYVNGPEAGEGLGAFISGSGNDFSVFVQLNATSKGYEAELLQIISGTVYNGGIKNLYYAIFMLNNFGNPDGYWMENGDGRIIYDSDGDSPIVESLYSLKLNDELISIIGSAQLIRSN